jgi:GNAT superfamily N-acetyltransferase
MSENPPIIYRDARPADAPRIVEFQLLMARETEGVELDREICSRGVSALFEDPGRGRYFVAESEGVVVASLMITYEWSDWRAAQIWWIQSVFVTPDSRRKGIYAGLYEHVQALVARDSGIGGIRLYVDRRNTSAREVYNRLGMNGEHYLVFEWMKNLNS